MVGKKVADDNQSKLEKAHKKLAVLGVVAGAPEFSGEVSVTISAHKGAIRKVKTVVVDHDD